MAHGKAVAVGECGVLVVTASGDVWRMTMDIGADLRYMVDVDTAVMSNILALAGYGLTKTAAAPSPDSTQTVTA